MKRNFFRISVVVSMGLVAMLINACQKDDVVGPVFNFNGYLTTVHLSLNHRYTDYAPTAYDEKDGNVHITSDKSSTNPNVDLVGTYIIHYSSSDNNGNISKTSRTIIVSNDANYIVGNYEVNDSVTGIHPYDTTYSRYVKVITSTTVNNAVYLYNFGDFGDYFYANAKVIISKGDTSLNLPYQPFVLTNGDRGNMNGNGKIVARKIISVDYTAAYTAVSPGNDYGLSTWTKKP